MLQNFFTRLFWFTLLLLLQALVFNHIHLMGYATPMPYVYFLLLLPLHTERWIYVGLGFLLGLAVDIFSNTPGAAAASSTLVGLLMPLWVQLFTPEDKPAEDFRPSARTMQWAGFIKLAATASLFQISGFFLLESFSFFDIKTLLVNIGGSWGLTLLFIIAIEHIRMNLNKRPA